MATYQPPIRAYRFSDAKLVSICIEKTAFAERDAAELATKGITALWVADLAARALAFAAAPTDAAELGEQVGATEERDAAADLLRDKVKELRSTVIRTFGERGGKFIEFGLKGIDRFDNDQLHAAALAAKGVAVKYAVQLATKGWEAADNTELQTLADDYLDLKKNQNIETGSRDSAQEERVVEGNAIYDLLQNQLCEAGKEYWRTLSAAKHNDYIIYDTASGSNPNQVTIQGVIRDNVTFAVLNEVTINVGGNTTQSTADGSFVLKFNVPALVTLPASLSKTGYETVNSTIQVQPGETITQDREMERTVLDTLQPNVQPNTTDNVNPLPAAATALRITLISGTTITIGLSNNGVTVEGTPVTITAVGVITEYDISVFGINGINIMAQNTSPTEVAQVKIEILG